MKPKSRRSFKALMIALLIAFGGGYAVYRNLFTPKVQVQTVARQWLDNSSGKSNFSTPRRTISHSSYRPKPVRTYGCHIPKYTSKKHLVVKHGKKRHGHGKKSHLAHQRAGHGYYRTGYNRAN